MLQGMSDKKKTYRPIHSQKLPEKRDFVVHTHTGGSVSCRKKKNVQGRHVLFFPSLTLTADLYAPFQFVLMLSFDAPSPSQLEFSHCRQISVTKYLLPIRQTIVRLGAVLLLVGMWTHTLQILADFACKQSNTRGRHNYLLHHPKIRFEAPLQGSTPP